MYQQWIFVLILYYRTIAGDLKPYKGTFNLKEMTSKPDGNPFWVNICLGKLDLTLAIHASQRLAVL